MYLIANFVESLDLVLELIERQKQFNHFGLYLFLNIGYDNIFVIFFISLHKF